MKPIARVNEPAPLVVAVKTAACVLVALGLVASAAHAETRCVADFSALGQGTMTVEIKPAAREGRVDALIDGRITHAGTMPLDEAVRPGLNLAADPNGSEFKQFNSAERSLVHLHSLRDNPPVRDALQLPFALADVRRMKTIDLVGKTDKFGGVVLLEAFDEHGASLGKLVRRVFVATCRAGA